MITKVREIILTRVEAEERQAIRQSEGERLAKECLLSILMIVVSVVLCAVSVAVLSDILEVTKSKEFAFGWLWGIGILATLLSIGFAGRSIRMFDPPTAEETEELGDRII